MRTTIDAAGRVVIPKPIRERLRLTAHREIEVRDRGDHVAITPVPAEVRLVERDGVPILEADEPLPVLRAEEVRDVLERTRR